MNIKYNDVMPLDTGVRHQYDEKIHCHQPTLVKK